MSAASAPCSSRNSSWVSRLEFGAHNCSRDGNGLRARRSNVTSTRSPALVFPINLAPLGTVFSLPGTTRRLAFVFIDGCRFRYEWSPDHRGHGSWAYDRPFFVLARSMHRSPASSLALILITRHYAAIPSDLSIFYRRKIDWACRPHEQRSAELRWREPGPAGIESPSVRATHGFAIRDDIVPVPMRMDSWSCAMPREIRDRTV